MSKFSLTIYINAILVHQGKPTFSLGVRKKERCMLGVLAVKEFMNCSWDDSGERERERKFLVKEIIKVKEITK